MAVGDNRRAYRLGQGVVIAGQVPNGEARHRGIAEVEYRLLPDPSRYLAGLTPLDVLRAGRIDRAEDALLALESGIYL